MPVVILLNGAPGVGKSTLARRYADDRPLSVVLDIDLLRSLVGGWRRMPGEAGLLARAMALSALGSALSAGQDVLVPQLLAREHYVDQLATAARDHGAPFVEVVITTSVTTATARYESRARAGHENLQVADATEDPREDIPRYAEAIQAMAARRPQTVVLTNEHGDDPYAQLLALVEAHR